MKESIEAQKIEIASVALEDLEFDLNAVKRLALDGDFGGNSRGKFARAHFNNVFLDLDVLGVRYWDTAGEDSHPGEQWIKVCDCSFDRHDDISAPGFTLRRRIGEPWELVKYDGSFTDQGYEWDGVSIMILAAIRKNVVNNVMSSRSFE